MRLVRITQASKLMKIMEKTKSVDGVGTHTYFGFRDGQPNRKFQTHSGTGTGSTTDGLSPKSVVKPFVLPSLSAAKMCSSMKSITGANKQNKI
jgi:hypothetical protein